MTGILDRIRQTTPESLDASGVTGDFSDVARTTYRPTNIKRGMVRIVEGADDLVHPMAGRGGGNRGSIAQDWSGSTGLAPSRETTCLECTGNHGGPSCEPQAEPMRDRQRGMIWHKMNELRALDAEAGATADEWWARQTNVTKDQASEWITRLKNKITTLTDAGVVPQSVQAPKANVWAEWRELAGKLAVVGGTRGTRFAVDTEPGAVNKVAFWRITPSRDGSKFYLNQVIGGQGPVKVRMSPEAMVSLARKIIDAGPVEAMIRYGLELGECGHCGRELTKDESRAAGIGPRCRKHMGGWR